MQRTTLRAATNPGRSARKKEAPRTAALHRAVGTAGIRFQISLSFLLKNEALKSSMFPDHTFYAKSPWSDATFWQETEKREALQFLEIFPICMFYSQTPPPKAVA
jgi:hypothetical protein